MHRMASQRLSWVPVGCSLVCDPPRGLLPSGFTGALPCEVLAKIQRVQEGEIQVPPASAPSGPHPCVWGADLSKSAQLGSESPSPHLGGVGGTSCLSLGRAASPHLLADTIRKSPRRSSAQKASLPWILAVFSAFPPICDCFLSSWRT